MYSDLPGMKEFVTKFMIRMSKDFATPSLEGEVARKKQSSIKQQGQLHQYRIDSKKLWEEKYVGFEASRLECKYMLGINMRHHA